MLSIFAIDPQICLNLEWFRYCVEHCQASRGRAIADLPPGEWCRRALTWIEEAIASASMGPVRGQSVKRRLEVARDRLVHRPGTWWDYGEPSWVWNAEQEHAREPFAAVVSTEYPEGSNSDHKYHPNDLGEDVPDWETESGAEISRSPLEFSKRILPALVVASEVHILDPYFSVDANSLFTKNYQELLSDLAASCDPFPKLTIHCCPEDDVDVGYFDREFRRLYEKMVPEGGSLVCVILGMDGVPERGSHPFHNRYVLTSKYGIRAGYGTDSAQDVTEAPDSLQFIARSLHQDLLNKSRNCTHPMVSVRAKIEVAG